MKVLMVCLGNICRSPLAEGIMKKMAAQMNMELEVASAGTSGWHEGEMADERAREVAANHGTDISGHRARKFQQEDFDRYDRIFVMDASNLSDVQAMCRNEADVEKVSLLTQYTTVEECGEIPDPYYANGEGFEYVYSLLKDCCRAFLQSIAP